MVEEEGEGEEAAAVQQVEHMKEALAESEENVGSYLEQYEHLVSSFVSNRCRIAVLGRPLGQLRWLSFLEKRNF